MNETNNGTIDIINEVISIIGKEGCIGCYKDMKARMPKIYEYRCKLLGHDIIEFVNGL